MTDTAKSAREIINEEIRFICAADIPSLGADRLLKKLREAGLEIRPIAATPAVGEVSEELAALAEVTYWAPYGDWKAVIAAIRPRLKAEGLREAANYLDKGTAWDKVRAQELRARADAMEKGEG